MLKLYLKYQKKWCLFQLLMIGISGISAQSNTYINFLDFNEQGDDIIISYDLAPLQSGQYYQVSLTGKMGNIPFLPGSNQLSGDIGKITSGGARSIVWHLKSDLGEFKGQISITLNADLYEVQQTPPPKDSDGDGIADDIDACPKEKGTFSDNGCPLPVPSSSTISEYTEKAASTFIVMNKIPGGTFTMGSNNSEARDNESPTHSVTLSGFYMGKYEVTQRQWKAIMGTDPSYNKNCDDCPVESVSWEDVQVFITKLNKKSGRQYRLPTEAEWEYAANRGQNYKYAGSDNIDDVAWYYINSGNKTQPVGQKKGNGFGLYDLTGNVCEWCADWYNSYISGSLINPTGPSSGSYRVFRGGSYLSIQRYCRITDRSIGAPAYRDNILGFRLVSPQ